MIRIAIYDRYLSTAGGGERYSCKAAQVLADRDGFSVDMLTDIHADKDEVSKKLNLDLSKVNLRVFPLISDDFAEEITRQYDVFINCTYLSALSSYAKKSIYLCYFPTPFDVDFKFIHRFLLLFRPAAIMLFKIASKMTSDFKEVNILEGLYESKRFLLRRGSWAGKKARIIFKKDIGDFALGLKNPSSSPLDKVDVRVVLGWADIVHEETITLKKGEKRIYRPPASLAAKMREKDPGGLNLTLYSDTFVPKMNNSGIEDSRELGFVVYDESNEARLKKLVLKAVGYVPLFLSSYPLNLRFLNTYEKIVSISEYSSGWIKRYWKRSSEILFPPVDIKSFKCTSKENIIVSVGRFFPEHHNKKQLELAEVFIDLLKTDPALMKGYRLCLAGGLSDKKSHIEYVNKIRKISEGYPIEILTNIGFSDLVSLFSKSKIFWHASGAGVSPGKHPEKFEHFGITTVEAMASGTIPIVINKGGQVEIIEDGKNGFLFEDFEELKKKTLEVIADEDSFEHIRQKAMDDSHKFSNENFGSNLFKIIEDLIDGN